MRLEPIQSESATSAVDVDIVGWVFRDEFIVQHTIENFGYGPNTVMRQDQLHPLAVKQECSVGTAEWMADIRGVKDRTKVKDLRVDQTRDSHTIDLLGSFGELAVAQWLGISLEHQWMPYGGDVGFDMISNIGNKIDVKATVYRPMSHLLFRRLNKFKADVAVLALVHVGVGGSDG